MKFQTSLLVKTIRRTAALSALAFSINAFAAGPEVNVNDNDVALKGYDPVAYFKESAPTKGSSEFTAVYNEAVYQFSSASNRDLFKSNPSKYAPAYGGYCAFGVTLDKKFDGDPNAWKIVDGTLYLNLNKDVQKKWAKKIPKNIAKADGNWPEIKYSTADYLADR